MSQPNNQSIIGKALLKGTPSPAGPQWIRELEFMEYSI